MNQRLERINNIIRDEISDLLRREIHDPLIGFVTITGVETSPDLRHAKVFFSVLGNTEEVKSSIKGVLRARKYLNSRLAERVDLRYTPNLRFVLDETAAKAQQMHTLLTREQDELAETMARHEQEAAEAAALAAEAGESVAPRDEFDELDELDELDDLGEDDEDDEDWDDEDEEDDEDEDFDDEDETLDPIR